MSIRYIQVGHGTKWYTEALELRDEVLRKPIGLEFPEYQVDLEVADIHVVGLEKSTENEAESEEIVACLLLHRLGPTEVKMRQVAVRTDRQGRGIGSGLVEASEVVARQLGFRSMVLNARATAVPFYLALDYQVRGDAFEEVGLPHFKMSKAL